MAPGVTPRMLASDLDGTLIPKDEAPQRRGEIEQFRRTAEAMGLGLAYVTGRHLALALEGIEEFDLPTPEAIACDVGTTVYWRRRGEYAADEEYREAVAATPGVVPASRIQAALADLADLRLQAPDRQAEFKVSYDIDPPLSPSTLAEVRGRLDRLGRSRLVVSHDAVTGTGLLDVLPESVGKAGAVHHIAHCLGLGSDEVIFAGDSGNDRDAMLSGVRAVLVGNAPDALRAELRAAAESKGIRDRVYFALRPFAAGVVQGLLHFNPLG